MALLMFEDTEMAPMRELLEQQSLMQLATDVNKTICQAYGGQSELKIGFYWQMLQWAQEQLKSQKLPNGKSVCFP